MDGANPGSGGGGCGGECEVNDDGECEVCVMWREISSYNPNSDGKKKFLVPAASDGSSSPGSGGGCGGECEMRDDGGCRDTSDNGDSGCGGECEMNNDGAKQFIPMGSDGSRDTSRPYILGQRTALPFQVERKVKEKLREIRSELPILVREMTATNAHGVGRGPCEMVFSMEYASACLPDRTHPLLLQMEGKSKLWHATLDIASQNRRRVYYGWRRETFASSSWQAVALRASR